LPCFIDLFCADADAKSFHNPDKRTDGLFSSQPLERLFQVEYDLPIGVAFDLE